MDQPENDLPADDARDDATAAAVLHDDTPQPGGGGLMGGEEAEHIRLAGGPAPNAPIDTGVAGGSASAEAKVRASAPDAP
jgi:hypothetical protein